MIFVDSWLAGSRCLNPISVLSDVFISKLLFIVVNGLERLGFGTAGGEKCIEKSHTHTLPLQNEFSLNSVWVHMPMRSPCFKFIIVKLEDEEDFLPMMECTLHNVDCTLLFTQCWQNECTSHNYNVCFVILFLITILENSRDESSPYSTQEVTFVDIERNARLSTSSLWVKISSCLWKWAEDREIIFIER